jgi:hypothetical protein
MALGYALAHYAFLFQDPVGIDAVTASYFLRLEGATNSLLFFSARIGFMGHEGFHVSTKGRMFRALHHPKDRLC